MKPWKTVSRKVVQRFGKFLTVEAHEIELPDGRRLHNWPWLISPDFVLVLPRTTDGRFLIFRQTKYAVKGLSLAPVGGHMDDGEQPLAAAKRETLEETGYTAAKWVLLGSYVLHANRGGGHGHLYLALDARRKCAPHADDLEEQELLFLTHRQLELAFDRHQFKVLSWSTLIAQALRYLNKPEKPSCSKPAFSTRKSTRC
ncbi:MAG: NUDIX hydrolase [Verrucomicrobia bacterium]|nr:NUDIX hydrolase [Verrucomicrobiota bacterium]